MAIKSCGGVIKKAVMTSLVYLLVKNKVSNFLCNLVVGGVCDLVVAGGVCLVVAGAWCKIFFKKFCGGAFAPLARQFNCRAQAPLEHPITSNCPSAKHKKFSIQARRIKSK